MDSHQSLAEKIAHAFFHKAWPDSEEPSFDRLSIADAYAVQDLVVKLRTAQGESVAGYKVGCTSAAIRSQFGLNEPISARLFYPHIFEEGTQLDWSNYANCAIEPEMVIRIGTDLRGHDLPDEILIHGIESVSPGLEIHNYRFWQSKPTLQELICSGGIHAGLVVGKTQVPPEALDYKEEVFSVYKDGERITSAPAAEIMGGPLHALRWLVNSLTDQGSRLRKDSLVIPGSPVELVPIASNTTLKVEIDRVGVLTTKFEAPQTC